MSEPAPADAGAGARSARELDELRERLAASERYIAATLARATRLTQIISVLGTDTELDRVIGRAATTVCELFSADLAVLMLGQDDALTIAGHWGVAARDVPSGPVAVGHLDRLMAQVPIAAGPAESLELPHWLARYQARHAAWARLAVGEKSLGLLLIVRRADLPFQPSDETELHAIASRLAMTVENGLLHERMRMQIARLAQLQAFTVDLAGTLELDAVAQRVADEVVCVADAQASAVYVNRPEPLAVSGPHEPSPAWRRIAIRTAAGTVGEVAVRRAPAPGSEADERLAHVLGLAGLALDKALLYERSREQARRDSLTGLLGHGTFHETLQALEERGETFTLLLADIDDFKQINDIHGHPAGDEALRAVATVIGGAVRTADTVFRIGGEEFCVLLPSLPAAAAAPIAERLRSQVEAIRAPVRATVSIGLAEFPADAKNREELLARADAALYASKAAGKNVTTLAVSLAGQERPLLAGGRLQVHLLQEQDPQTAAHSLRVADLAVAVGRELRLAPQQLRVLRRAAMLRDIGNIGVPRAVLEKPGPLDAEELRLMRAHCLIGAELLDRGGEPDVAGIVRQHHENVDGSGYPQGLCGEAITIEARIARVVDSYVAMTVGRSHRPARSPAEAACELRRCAGSEFDSDVVEALCTVLASAELEPSAAELTA